MLSISGTVSHIAKSTSVRGRRRTTHSLAVYLAWGMMPLTRLFRGAMVCPLFDVEADRKGGILV